MKKLLVVGVIVLFLGLAIAPSINANVSKDDELVENIGRQYLIFGTGDTSWLHVENESWKIGGKFRKLYNTNLIVGNSPGMLSLGYCIFIKDLKSGEIFNKETLPRHIYLNGLLGYMRANYYSYTPHGPVGFYFTIIGLIENYHSWET